jgi:hypothetical protein
LPLATNQGLERYQVRIVTVSSADPAAGAEISYTIPTGQLFEVTAVTFALVTSATAANRRVALTFDDGTNVFFKSVAQVVQTASLTWTYSAGAGGVDTTSVAGTDMKLVLPVGLILPGGYRIRTASTALEADDNYGIARIQGIRYSA